MKALFHISQLAARSGRSIHTIRWYETLGLIPGVSRDKGGRRVYAEAHVGWLDLMNRLRRTGMSIAQMRKYTALVKQREATLSERKSMLQAHRDRVQRQIADWQEALELLDDKIQFYDKWQESGQRPPLNPTAHFGNGKVIR